MTYDPQNIFAKILRKEISARVFYEDETILAFFDIQPQAPMHLVIIPKAPIISYDDFIKTHNDQEISRFFRSLHAVCQKANAIYKGYRLVTNVGSYQEVPHFHFHLLLGGSSGAEL